MYFLKYVGDFYTDLMENRSDPRVKDWPLMSGPAPTILICLTYVFIVKVVGPKLMENIKPIRLRKTLIVYNGVQVMTSAWFLYESIVGGWFSTYSFRCQPVDYSYSPKALRATSGCWWFFVSRFFKFIDSFFLIIHKKSNNLSRYHIIHHAVMPLSTWFGVKFTPGGHSTFFGMVNSITHLWAYGNCLLVCCGVPLNKYSWWRRHLTIIMMVEFVLVALHEIQLLFIECDYPKVFAWWIGLHAILFLFLNCDFKWAYNKIFRKKVKPYFKTSLE